MFDDLSLTHQQQQEAVEKIQKLMAEGMSTAEAIKVVAQEIREQHKNAWIEGTFGAFFIFSYLTAAYLF